MKARASLVIMVLAVSACGKGAQRAPSQVPASHASTAAPSAASAVPPLPYAYPATRREDIVDTLFGVRVPDPYRWLEDAQSEETRAWMKTQDDFARKELEKLPERDAIAARLKEVLYVDSLGVPGHRGHRYFVTSRPSFPSHTGALLSHSNDGPQTHCPRWGNAHDRFVPSSVRYLYPCRE